MAVVLLAVVSLQTGFAATTNINNTTSGGINGALSSSNDGDIIELDEGTYTGNNNTNMTINKNITIQGKTKDKVILDAQGLSRIFGMNNNLNVTFINITFFNAKATIDSYNGNGGAIFNNYNGTIMNFINCTFTQNNAIRGGGIFTTGNITVENSIFTQNNADIGSGILISSGTNGLVSVNILNSIFTNNTAILNAPGIYVSATLLGSDSNSTINVNISNSTFTNNTVLAGSGGGIAITGANGIVIANIFDSIISNNSISHNGGGILITAGNGIVIANIFDSVISNNSAGNDGGGILITAGNGIVDVNIFDSVISNNSAGNDGGGISATTGENNSGNGTVNVYNSSINDNSAGNNGGALSANTGVNSTGDSTINVFDSDIENNTAGNNGDSIFATTGDGSTGNSEVNVGGNSKIINNNPDKNDDGIYRSTGDGSSGSSSINIADGVIKRLSASSTIIVSKAIIGKPTTIRGVAKDQNNNPLANTNLTVTIDGKTYTVTTNGAGEWSLTYIPTRTGNIQIRVTLNQNNVYAGFISSTNFNVTKRNIIATITVKENKDGSVTIIANATYEDDNSPASGYQVDFLLDGKIVGTGITNKNGIAKFTIPANKITNGQHKITAIVHGAETVNNGTASVKFTIISPDIPENDTNDTNKTSSNPVATAAMKETGMPIIAILLALISLIGIGIRKKQN